ncbi:MAG: lysophospholipid acyltransferase family protein [Pseudobdellovibrionaceae bacterium]
MILKILSYPRSLLSALIYPPFIIFYSIATILAVAVFRSRRLQDFLMTCWARQSCYLFGVDVELHGEALPAHQGCVYVFNHTSFFDIFAIQGWIKNLRFGAKIELYKIPFFGKAMQMAGVLPIARQSKEDVFKVYEEAQSRLSKGEKFALAPEGTRQHNEKIGSFKSGPFIFAINCQVPLVPVVVCGAAQALPNDKWIPMWGIWSKKIQVSILPAVATTGLAVSARSQLQVQIKAQMESELARLQGATQDL